MPHDDDLGSVGGVGSDGHFYGGKRNIARKHVKPLPEMQIRTAFDGVIAETAGQSLTQQQLARRLRIWLRDEYDVFLSEQEALVEVQKRQS